MIVMDISKEIIESTTNCEKDFACLKSDGVVCCKVESCINGKIHFVQNVSKSYCAYKMSFGNSFICNCPTRKEIFNKYSI